MEPDRQKSGGFSQRVLLMLFVLWVAITVSHLGRDLSRGHGLMTPFEKFNDFFVCPLVSLAVLFLYLWKRRERSAHD